MKPEYFLAGTSASLGILSFFTSSIFAREAENLNENTMVKAIQETAEQTKERLSDADWYEDMAGDLSMAGICFTALAVALIAATKSPRYQSGW